MEKFQILEKSKWFKNRKKTLNLIHFLFYEMKRSLSWELDIFFMCRVTVSSVRFLIRFKKLSLFIRSVI